MISVDVADHRFQLRAAAVIVEDDFVLLHRFEGDAYWALPGGRVEAGEDATATLVREMREEVGEPISCGELLFVVENFFAIGSRPYHEIGLYFATCLAGASPLRDRTGVHLGSEGKHRLEFRWFTLAQVASLDLHPSFLRHELAAPRAGIKHIVQRG